jgi:hypothetical protein
VLLVLLISACTYSAKAPPNGKIRCDRFEDCPTLYRCVSFQGNNVCCRAGVCETPAPGNDGDGGRATDTRSDFGSGEGPSPMGSPDGGALDAGPGMPPARDGPVNPPPPPAGTWLTDEGLGDGFAARHWSCNANDCVSGGLVP